MTDQRSTPQLKHATSKLDFETGTPQNKPTLCTAAVAGFATGDDKAAAIREAVELAGGMPWLAPGETVLIKPALNSGGPFPYTASAVACAELVRMCLERGAARVFVADETGLEYTLSEEDLTGHFRGFEKDTTIHNFKTSGIWDAVTAVADEIDARKRVHITTFRELGWSRYELLAQTTAPDGSQSYVSHLYSPWVMAQTAKAETWYGNALPRSYLPRWFDAFRSDVPGLYVPTLFDRVDHIINLFRLATHIWSHYTMAIKNWVGTMRPDERTWLHQLNYLRNYRNCGNGVEPDNPIRNEAPYHEMLADLHLPHAHKERLFVADAGKIILSGGPDGSDSPFHEPKVILATNDLVAADVLGLAVLRYGIIEAPDGLQGHIHPQPRGWIEAGYEFFGELDLPPTEKRVFRGTDVKLADRQFSNWDWVAVQRARELSLGALGPDDIRLCFAESATPFEVPDPIHAWIVEDVRRRPRFEVTPVGPVTAPMTGTFVPEAEPAPLAYRDVKSRSKA
jgi:uncharacterized protein (DUF362 family)